MLKTNTPEAREGAISRRNFAQRAALVAATVVIPVGKGFASGVAPGTAMAVVPQRTDREPLPADSQARVDAMVENIFRKYGARFSDEQKQRLRQNADRTERMLRKVRAFPLENWDPPAEVLKLD
jgi:hypothetical protein